VPTLSPTPTPSPTLPPAIPTSPPSPTPCPQAIDPAFSVLLDDSTLGQSLGCPQAEAFTTTAARQNFEQGFLLWREDSNLIYILEPDHTWSFTGDTWREGDDSFDPAIVAPDGLYQPVRGFGLVWRQQPGVREALGWGIAEEEGFEALIQVFTGGLAWLDAESDFSFILFNDGTYQGE
jgi:hypothetical protein